MPLSVSAGTGTFDSCGKRKGLECLSGTKVLRDQLRCGSSLTSLRVRDTVSSTPTSLIFGGRNLSFSSMSVTPRCF